MSSLRNSHPFFKNRINKYQVDEVKTWVDVEHTIPFIEDVYDDIQVQLPRIELATSLNRNTNMYKTSSEKDLEGLYCKDITYLYLSPDNHDSVTCKNIKWNCQKCDICQGRRRLDIIDKIWDKFEQHKEIDRDNLYLLKVVLKQDSVANITKALKYKGFDNLLFYWIHDDTVHYILNGDMLHVDHFTHKITLEYAVTGMKIRDPCQMLGKFYGKSPSHTIMGATEEERIAFENQEHKKRINEYCNCGEAYADHTLLQTSPSMMIDSLVPADHYEEGHKAFIRDHFNIT